MDVGRATVQLECANLVAVHTKEAAPATPLAELDDRGYREAQLDAGLASGRLQLAAFALGLGATGMTFVDARLPAVLGEPLAGLLLTCVGVPSYRHRPGGPPGAPTRMRPLR